MYSFDKLLDINMIYVIFIHLYNFSFNVPNIAVITVCRAFNKKKIYIYIKLKKNKNFIYLFVYLFVYKPLSICNFLM